MARLLHSLAVSTNGQPLELTTLEALLCGREVNETRPGPSSSDHCSWPLEIFPPTKEESWCNIQVRSIADCLICSIVWKRRNWGYTRLWPSSWDQPSWLLELRWTNTLNKSRNHCYLCYGKHNSTTFSITSNTTALFIMLYSMDCLLNQYTIVIYW